jgi:hypothetical protein
MIILQTNAFPGDGHRTASQNLHGRYAKLAMKRRLTFKIEVFVRELMPL